MKMNWIFNLIDFICGGCEKYDKFVKETSIKHLWFASFLDVLAKVMFGVIFVGIPAFIAFVLVALFVKFVMVFPILGGIAIVALIIWIAMLFSAFELYKGHDKKGNDNNPKKEEIEESPIPEAERNTDEGSTDEEDKEKSAS